ncbi:Aste57867_20888 [Aphanomyces stellatus]|uniref:Aste57867_20888 protein n=1 Tax=Aphanomyces stellatus TaxID=120398 RepID=A0A485LKT6_9STRA|nr:hypothetical protein As57867_020820 [Aphanomyces stellatus]VFT97565.1 Aste57867_20888 [Aphanomyces stellatus]
MPKSGKRKRSSDDSGARRAEKRSTADAKKDTHNAYMKEYEAWSSTKTSEQKKAWLTPDEAALREKHQFLRDEADDAVQGETDWKVRMAVRYYQKLFKEYALADFSRYTEGKVGLRWRTEREVVDGKGQFVCGNKACDAGDGLESYEVLFAYVEGGEKKQCLVKLRVCPACAVKLFYKKIQEIQRHHDKKHTSADKDIRRMLRGKQVDDEDDAKAIDEGTPRRQRQDNKAD